MYVDTERLRVGREESRREVHAPLSTRRATNVVNLPPCRCSKFVVMELCVAQIALTGDQFLYRVSQNQRIIYGRLINPDEKMSFSSRKGREGRRVVPALIFWYVCSFWRLCLCFTLRHKVIDMQELCRLNQSSRCWAMMCKEDSALSAYISVIDCMLT